jgi:predicted metal-dependent peptidase
MSRRRSPTQRLDPREVAWQAGVDLMRGNALFSFAGRPHWHDVPQLALDRGYAHVTSHGEIVCRRGISLDPDEWYWVLAHLALHCGLGHLDPTRTRSAAGDAAACLDVNRFLRESHIGREAVALPAELPRRDLDLLVEEWRRDGIPQEFRHCGAAGFGPDVLTGPVSATPHDWPGAFAASIARAAADAIDLAGGVSGPGRVKSVWERARGWFVSSYPLLGGLAAHFTIVADLDLARGWDISIAAVNAEAGEIYLNPHAGLDEDEWRFALAHEMLHAALRHGDRVGGRDAYLWNVACDYVINGWLVEMRVGAMPDGLLHDPGLAGLSAEAVYDQIVTDLRRLRKLRTLRGQGLGDVLGEPLPHPSSRGGVDLDEYYRRALATGLAYYDTLGRGVLPAGLVEEIRALDQPPLPWDARLARWFEEFVRTPEKHRSYARPSRRQSATPDIPRPGWAHSDEQIFRCTFGVVIDTSGSMDRTQLGKALGAIASYATARDVPRARVVFCDAAAYDAGYLDVETIAGRVKVRGRGGTVLQPGVTLLERAEDFPVDAPILIITDAQCDVVRIRREHAFLVPPGARPPFTPKGPVFHMTP